MVTAFTETLRVGGVWGGGGGGGGGGGVWSREELFLRKACQF